MAYYRLPSFNPKCKECKLSTGESVCGQSELPFADVRLIIISAYPGRNEVKQGISLAANKTASGVSAGYFLREVVAKFFDADPNFPEHLKPFYERIFTTNVIKCEKKDSTVTDSQIKTCGDKWLASELELFPKAPILIASGEATKYLIGFKAGGLYKNRNQLHKIGDRLAVVSLNPIEWERNTIRVVTESTRNSKTGVESPVTVKDWAPVPVGSVMWHVLKDLRMIKRLVVEFDGNSI